jgi:hypothetical protein
VSIHVAFLFSLGKNPILVELMFGKTILINHLTTCGEPAINDIVLKYCPTNKKSQP